VKERVPAVGANKKSLYVKHACVSVKHGDRALHIFFHFSSLFMCGCYLMSMKIIQRSFIFHFVAFTACSFCESDVSALESKGSVKLRVFEGHLFLSGKKKKLKST
jgi:hypothetical protein